eukprot:538538-Pleurochrysis_carterae.AAC.3
MKTQIVSGANKFGKSAHTSMRGQDLYVRSWDIFKARLVRHRSVFRAILQRLSRAFCSACYVCAPRVAACSFTCSCARRRVV